MFSSAFFIVQYYTLENSFAVLIILPPSHGILFSFVWLFLYLTSQSFSNSDLCCILCSTHCFNSVPIIAIPVRLFLLILSFVSYLLLIPLLPLCFLFSFPLFPKQYFYLVYLSLLLHFLPIFLCFHSESSWFSYTYPCTNNDRCQYLPLPVTALAQMHFKPRAHSQCC